MWTKFIGLSRRERRLFAAALVMLPLAELRLRAGATAALDAPGAGRNSSGRPVPEVIGEAARMVKAAARFVPGSPACLPQSIVLQRLLRHEGVETALRIGVRKDAGTLDAHAWIEYEGVAVTDPVGVPDRFTVLSR